MTKFGVSQSVRRVEDIRFITGTGNYSDDMRLDGQLHGYVLRSPHAHATILSVDADDARTAPGVHAVITGQDMQDDGVGALPSLWPVTNKDGSDWTRPPHFALAYDKVRTVGDGVAFVVADTLQQAKDAAEMIMVDYDELPAVTCAVAAQQPGAPVLHEDAPDNVVFDWGHGDEARTMAAMENADRVIELDLINNRVVVNSMETRVAISDWNNETERLTLYTPTQGGWGIKAQLAGTLGLKPKQIRVVTPDVGGGFGMKLFFYPEHLITAYASKKLGRPVRWTSERQEAFLADAQGRDHQSVARMAIDKDGKFLGLHVKTAANLGAYLSTVAGLIPTVAYSKVLVGVYDIPTMYMDVQGVMTNTVPVDAYRGAGRPEAIYLIERMVNHVALELGISQDEVRRRNFVQPDQMPYTTATGETYDSGDFPQIMEKALVNSDWAGFDARKAESAKHGLKRGIGMTYYIEATAGTPEEAAAITFDNGIATVYVGTQSNGQGHETAFTQVVSDRLGIDAENIKIVMGDTDAIPTGGGTGGSRSLVSQGTAIHKASDTIIDKGKASAGEYFETAAVDIEFNDGQFSVAGTDRKIDIMELADIAKMRQLAGNEDGLDTRESAKFNPVTYPNGCHVLEVEVDPATGTTTLDRYTIVDDFGKVVSPMMVESQVHGGVVQGVGQALSEHAVYDEYGQLQAGSFMDYGMPRADLFPSLDFERIEIPCKSNMLGTKGAGEAGCVAGAPVLINAIINALQDDGVTDLAMPANPQSVWRAIQAAKAS